MAEYQNWGITQYKPQELQDDGNFGSASPTSEPTSSPLGNTQRKAAKALGAFAVAKVGSTVISNVKTLTGSSALQESVNRGVYVFGSLTAAYLTGGWSIAYQIIDKGASFYFRYKQNQIENEARQEERKMLGESYTNSMGSAYYD